MTVNELSKQSGIHPETIRYYEKTGVLPTPKRQANGYRCYDDNTLELLRFIKTCRSLGFSVEEVKQLNHIKSHPQQHGLADRMIIRQLANVEEKIMRLNEIRHFLQNLVMDEGHSEADCKALHL
ncbi:MerR family transcriptional regulator [Actinobacillus succinogenes]|uniref:Putative transcriptional regulator, MerR family n=1 Tax=Actinobacillus succinogenes (strain ATCC 55618 / DSM 22257 / CCUG 43843 / 130Z) TaxID=339671 RepID=A6VPH9_ACTSZ|nr:MerR family transcriptional regulator [Actinobacillus succinogenes]ABR74876.1 putative transcriptional regulator, MerR family [Actinobacillus succinogenes 130Z]PHI40714.1 MerR family transcriptional regulator [Actinobacillus succinogenes]